MPSFGFMQRLATDHSHDAPAPSSLALSLSHSLSGGQVLSSKSFLTVAKELCSEALIMGSTDNVTALVVDLRNRFRRPTQPPAQ